MVVTAAIGRSLSNARVYCSGSLDACRRQRAAATTARRGDGDEPLTQFNLHRLNLWQDRGRAASGRRAATPPEI
jgi:hypothetical protein